MQLSVRPVRTRSQLYRFIHLPARLHAGRDRWVPPLYREEWAQYNPRRNRAHQYCDTTLALAYDGDRVVGRIQGIINRRYNSGRNERTARFAALESVEAPEVVETLLSHVENWAQSAGMDHIIGPYGFTDQEPQGFLLEGFEHEPTFATYHNHEYLPDMVRGCGYTKAMDYVVYKVPLIPPVRYERIRHRILCSNRYRLLEFSSRREVKPYILPALELVNLTFEKYFGYSQLDLHEMQDLAATYMPAIDPRLVKVVMSEHGMAGFVLGIPNLSAALRRSRGYLLPFGFIHLLQARRNALQLDLMIGAIHPDDQRRGLNAVLGYSIINSGIALGYDFFDSHHELENNSLIRREMQSLGGHVYKRFRVFQKDLQTEN